MGLTRLMMLSYSSTNLINLKKPVILIGISYQISIGSVDNMIWYGGSIDVEIECIFGNIESFLSVSLVLDSLSLFLEKLYLVFVVNRLV